MATKRPNTNKSTTRVMAVASRNRRTQFCLGLPLSGLAAAAATEGELTPRCSLSLGATKRTFGGFFGSSRCKPG